jgi:hypothetical protein
VTARSRRVVRWEVQDSTRNLAVALVRSVDRRVLPAIGLLAQLVSSETYALHVATDAMEAGKLARTWMELEIDWLPLRIEEPSTVSLAGSVRAIVQREAASRPNVVVLIPELDLDRWWQPLLHRGTGRDIARHLHGVPHVTSVVLPVPLQFTC